MITKNKIKFNRLTEIVYRSGQNLTIQLYFLILEGKMKFEKVNLSKDPLPCSGYLDNVSLLYMAHAFKSFSINSFIQFAPFHEKCLTLHHNYMI